MHADLVLPFLERLRSAPARVLVTTSALEGTALWVDRGYEVVHLPPGSPLTAGSADLLVATRDTLSGDIGRGLDRLWSALAPGGILLLAARLAWGGEPAPGTLSAPDVVASLYEKGFVLTERRTLEPGTEEDAAPPLRRDGPVRDELLIARRDEHRVRSFRAGDEEAILALFREAFPHDQRPLAHWLWKYRDHPHGGPFLSLAVDDDGRIGAHYAGYPVRFRDATGPGPRRFTAFQIGDTMTAAWAHRLGGRRTSLLARATQHFFHRHCAHRIAFNYGFNTGKIHRFYLRLVPGSQYLEPSAYRVLELARHRPPPPGSWDRSVGGLRVQRVTTLDPEWDRFFEAVAPAYGLLAERDATHLDWRFLGRPDTTYLLLAVRRRNRLVGWGVFRRQEDRLVWGDSLFSPPRSGDAAALLHAALDQPEAEGVSQVEGWFPDRPAFWDATLTQLGFERRHEPRDLALIFMEFEERDLARRLARDLYYTLADSDLF